MTCLRYRLKRIEAEMKKENYSHESIVLQLQIIKDNLKSFGDSLYPPCCLVFKDGFIKCDYLGFIPEKSFFDLCRICRREVEEKLKKLEEFMRRKIQKDYLISGYS